MRVRYLLVCAAFTGSLVAAQSFALAPAELPASATTRLARSLDAAQAHVTHVWRDPAPTNADGTVNAYIEISRGDRRKWELDMAANARRIDRVMPESIGGYPVNYGFVPQTISYDGDPFDALVLGPPIPGGRTVRGIVVGLMYMEDEKGPDSKVVLSIPSPDRTPLHALTAAEQERIGSYFQRYKEHEPGAFSRVPGWGSASEGMSFVTRSHMFFLRCREREGQPCALQQ
jgi:inorganic pyrophosphatase